MCGGGCVCGESGCFRIGRGQRKMVNLILAKFNGYKFCGYVYDDSSHIPIENVSVTARCNSYEQYTRTDKSGKFELTMPEGLWQVVLTFYKSGYVKKNRGLYCGCNRNFYLISI